MRPKRPGRLTVEQLADDCIDVHEINRANMFCDHWVTAPFSFRRPKIVKMRVAQYKVNNLSRQFIDAPANSRILDAMPLRWGEALATLSAL